VYSSPAGALTATTSRLQDARLAGVRLALAVVFNDSVVVFTGFAFTFIDGPIISAVSPRLYIYTSV